VKYAVTKLHLSPDITDITGPESESPSKERLRLRTPAYGKSYVVLRSKQEAQLSHRDCATAAWVSFEVIADYSSNFGRKAVTSRF